MAKGKASKSKDVGEDVGVEEKRKRDKVHYEFVDNRAENDIHPIGLTMHTPSEAAIVKEFLKKHSSDLGIEGEVMVRTFKMS